MTEYDAPPFDSSDPDRHEIWRMLVERDTDAFLRRDWNAVSDDFAAADFFGLDARGRYHPGEWQLRFPNLAAYRDEWLRQAEEAERLADAARARAALFAATTLREIDIRGDLALARKRFDGVLPHRNGGGTRLDWQTLYICRRQQGRWKVASFVGYLPQHDCRVPAAAVFPAAGRQHRTAGPYTPVMGVDLSRGARLYVVSGQAPIDADGQVIGVTIAEQSRATLQNCNHMDFDGTLTVRHETLMHYLIDVLDSVAVHGFDRIVLLNSHGGNEAIGRVVLEKWGASHPRARIFMFTWWRVAAWELASLQESGFGGVGHACEFETSLLQYFAPQLVAADRIRDPVLRPTFDWAESDMLNAPCGLLYRSMKEMSGGSGVVGAPTYARAEKGRRISDLVVGRLAAMLTDIRCSARNAQDSSSSPPQPRGIPARSP